MLRLTIIARSDRYVIVHPDKPVAIFPAADDITISIRSEST